MIAFGTEKVRVNAYANLSKVAKSDLVMVVSSPIPKSQCVGC